MITVRNMHSQVQYGTNLQYSVRGTRGPQFRQLLEGSLCFRKGVQIENDTADIRFVRDLRR
jgi:hypothetical protein